MTEAEGWLFVTLAWKITGNAAEERAACFGLTIGGGVGHFRRV